MSRKFIIAFATVAALASTALVVAPAFARSGGNSGNHSIGRSGGHGSGHVSSHVSRGKSIQHGGNRSGSKFSGNHKPGKVTGLQSQKTGKLGSGPGKLNSGPGKPGSGSAGLANGPGKQGAAAGGNNAATANNGLKAGPAAGKVYRDQMGPTNNTTPTNQNANNQNPPPNNGGVRPPQGNMGPIVTGWGNAFKQNIQNSFNPWSPGTGFSACEVLALCAAVAPPGAVWAATATAPLSGFNSSLRESAVNAFTPTDPKDPLSTPIDIVVRKPPTLNPFGTDAFRNSLSSEVTGIGK
jgi:hypothetical protein